jgi:hypothetical protein
VTVFLLRLSRGARALRELLGADHDRVVTSDCYSTYEVVPLERRQVCWAHLRRDFQAMIDRQNDGAPIGENLLLLSDAVFRDWHRVRDGTLTGWTFRRRTEDWYRPDVRRTLEAGTVCGCAPTAATCRELLALEPALWTFTRVAGVEPTNNAAEQALRGPVLWRKGSYGTDGASGSRFVEAILTAVASCRQQGRNVWAFVTGCCEAWRHNTAPPALIPQAQPKIGARSPRERLLDDILFPFRKHKELAEKAFRQVEDQGFFQKPGEHSNSIAIILKHIAGNLASRWTGFLTTDGDKPWRDRDAEFVIGPEDTRPNLLAAWERGWTALFQTLGSLQEAD